MIPQEGCVFVARLDTHGLSAVSVCAWVCVCDILTFNDAHQGTDMVLNFLCNFLLFIPAKLVPLTHLHLPVSFILQPIDCELLLDGLFI